MTTILVLAAGLAAIAICAGFLHIRRDQAAQQRREQRRLRREADEQAWTLMLRESEERESAS